MYSTYFPCLYFIVIFISFSESIWWATSSIYYDLQARDGRCCNVGDFTNNDSSIHCKPCNCLQTGDLRTAHRQASFSNRSRGRWSTTSLLSPRLVYNHWSLLNAMNMFNDKGIIYQWLTAQTGAPSRSRQSIKYVYATWGLKWSLLWSRSQATQSGLILEVRALLRRVAVELDYFFVMWSKCICLWLLWLLFPFLRMHLYYFQQCMSRRILYCSLSIRTLVVDRAYQQSMSLTF
jgi:hypothetical protein